MDEVLDWIDHPEEEVMQLRNDPNLFWHFGL